MSNRLGRAKVNETKRQPAGEAVAERRRAPRKRTLKLKQGWIDCGATGPLIDCAVLDIFGTGAKVRVADSASCPSGFLLRVRFGRERACSVVWRAGTLLGLRFAD